MLMTTHAGQTCDFDASGVLFFYLMSYYLLLFILALYFSSSARLPNIKYTREAAAITSASLARAVLLGCVLALTGLPPMPFFIPKLAIIGMIINSKSATVSAAALAIIFTGWFLYAKLASSLLSGLRAMPHPSALRVTSTCTFGAVAVVLAGVFLLGGIFFSSPLVVWCHWVALPALLCYKILSF
jgi:NADH:ubiquinone oxidoreductase subunit 2 (subunit N)